MMSEKIIIKEVVEKINGVTYRLRYGIGETKSNRKRQNTSGRSAKASRSKKKSCYGAEEEEQEQQEELQRRQLPSRTQKLKNRLLKKAISEKNLENLQQEFDCYDFSKAIQGSALPFVYAVEFGSLDVLKFLASRTENPFSQHTDDGQTAFMKSLKCKNYNRPIVEYLLINSEMNVFDDLNNSALIFASKNIYCAPETFKMLLKNCESQISNERMISFIDAKNRDGYSALMLLHKSKLEIRSSGTPNQNLEEALDVKIKMLINMGANKIPAEAENTLESKFWPEYRKRIEKEEQQAERNYQPPKLSQYELERNARIDRNQVFLASLGLK